MQKNMNLETNESNSTQEASAEAKMKRRRRVGIAVVACVSVLAIGFAFLMPSLNPPTRSGPEESAVAATDLPSAEASRAGVSSVPFGIATPLPSATPSSAAPTPAPATERPHITPNFDNAAVVGSSTTQGLYNFGTFPGPDYYYHTSLTLQGLYDTVMPGADKPIIEQLGDKQYDQIFLSFGLNELGWDQYDFLKTYEQVICDIREKQPHAVIYLESILPVGPVTSSRNRFNVNQDRINAYNASLESFAPEHGAYYLDVSTELKDETGYLPDAISADGIHLNAEGCARWAALLQARVEELLNAEGGPVVPDLAALAEAAATLATADPAMPIDPNVAPVNSAMPADPNVAPAAADPTVSIDPSTALADSASPTDPNVAPTATEPATPADPNAA